jgi:hypothetical protein
MAIDAGDRTAARVLLLSHAAAVAFLVVVLVVSLVGHDSPDANIGAGLIGLALGGLGLPWSIPVYWAPSSDLAYALVGASAVVNVLLHAWLVRRAGRRRS